MTVTNYSLTATNIIVAATNGFAPNDLLIFSNGYTNRTLTVYGFASTTNIQVTTGVGATQFVNSDVFHLNGTTTTFGLGATTNKAFSGEALYVAPRGRPLRIVIDGTSYSSADVMSARYE